MGKPASEAKHQTGRRAAAAPLSGQSCAVLHQRAVLPASAPATSIAACAASARAIRRLDLQTTGMEFASEMVVRSALAGLRIEEGADDAEADGAAGRPICAPGATAGGT